MAEEKGKFVCPIFTTGSGQKTPPPKAKSVRRAKRLCEFVDDVVEKPPVKRALFKEDADEELLKGIQVDDIFDDFSDSERIQDVKTMQDIEKVIHNLLTRVKLLEERVAKLEN